MIPQRIPFTSFRPSDRPYTRFELTSTHKILGPAPLLPAFGQGTIIGDTTVKFEVHPGVNPPIVTGSMWVDLVSARAPVMCTMLWF